MAKKRGALARRLQYQIRVYFFTNHIMSQSNTLSDDILIYQLKILSLKMNNSCHYFFIIVYRHTKFPLLPIGNPESIQSK